MIFMVFGDPRNIESTGAHWLPSFTSPINEFALRPASAPLQRTNVIPMPQIMQRMKASTTRTRRRPAHYAPAEREPRNLLIVGTDSVAQDVREYFEAMPELGYKFRGFVQTAREAQDIEHIDGTVGSFDNIFAVARSMFVEDLIFSGPVPAEYIDELLAEARVHETSVRYVPGVSETLRRAHEVEYIGDLPTIVLYRKVRRTFPLVVKRCIDIVFSIVALIALSPLFAAIAVAIKLTSRGSVFYASERVGRKGRIFTCYKFRTMVPNAEALRSQLMHLNERQGVLFKMSNDPRVTSIGRVLRKYSLDELPQLWNVLRGDMSLVGPRPCIQSELAQYQTAHFRRLDVVPGITGLWQVEARHDPSFDSYIELDSKYVSDWSVLLDLKIMLRTLRVVILGTGV
jgi:exopolysaccharide biosynthesis polyprenyl glycosylphosphotransferase